MLFAVIKSPPLSVPIFSALLENGVVCSAVKVKTRFRAGSGWQHRRGRTWESFEEMWDALQGGLHQQTSMDVLLNVSGTFLTLQDEFSTHKGYLKGSDVIQSQNSEHIILTTYSLQVC